MAGPTLTGGVGLSPSIGFGIGIQAKPDTQGYNFAAQGIQQANLERQRKEAAKAKKEEDAEEEWRKYAANIKVSKDIDPMYEGKVKKLTGKHIALMAEQRRLSPHAHPDENEQLLQSGADLSTDLNIIANNTAAIKQFDSLRAPLMSSGKYDINDENMKIFNEAREKKDPSILERMKDEKGNPVIQGGAINPTSLGQAIFKEKPFQIIPYSKGIAKSLGIQSWKTEADKGDVFETIGGSGISPDVLKDRMKTLIYTGDAGAMEVLKKYGGDGASLDNEESVNLAADKWTDVMKTFIPSKSEQTLSQKQSGGIGAKELAELLKKDVDVKGGIKINSGNPAIAPYVFEIPADTKLSGYVAFPKGQVSGTSVVPSGTVDATTGKLYDEPGVNKGIVYQARAILPFNKETKEWIKDPAEELELKKTGKVVYKDVIPAVVTEKDPALYREGEIPVTKQVFMPSTPFRSVIQSKGIDMDLVDKEVISRNNYQKAPAKMGSKKDSTAKVANEVKRKTKDGKIAIFNADTKEFIRYE